MTREKLGCEMLHSLSMAKPGQYKFTFELGLNFRVQVVEEHHSKTDYKL